MLQQGPPKPQDAVDMIMQSVERLVNGIDENGQKTQTMVPNNWSLWWKTQMAASPVFARFAYKLNKMITKANTLHHSMCVARANVIKEQIMGFVEAYMYSIDSMSSITVRDKDNSQSNLNHLLLRQHMEVTKTFKGDLKEAGRLGFMGGNNDDQR